MKGYTDISYMIKVGDLYLECLGVDGISLTNRENEAKKYLVYDSNDKGEIIEVLNKLREDSKKIRSMLSVDNDIKVVCEVKIVEHVYTEVDLDELFKEAE